MIRESNPSMGVPATPEKEKRTKEELARSVAEKLMYLFPKAGVSTGQTEKIGGYGYGPQEVIPIHRLTVKINEELEIEAEGTGREGCYGGFLPNTIKVDGVKFSIKDLDEDILQLIETNLATTAQPYINEDENNRQQEQEAWTKRQEMDSEKRREADAIKGRIIEKLRATAKK